MLPSIFHDDALQASFVGEKLPARYFGDVNEHTTAVAGDRATHDLYFRPNGTKITEENPIQANEKPRYVAAGDLIPVGFTFVAGDAYTVNNKIICKVYTKLPPLLQSFSVPTDFFNAKNLSTNMYLTFGHSELEPLASEALVTVYDTAE